MLKLIDGHEYSHRKKSLFLILTVVACLFYVGQEAAACNVCHSKNPKMVRMHEELGFKDCFKCHGEGLEKNPEKKKAEMTEDSRCTPCHKK